MRNHGILIRNCENYRGLGRGWYRVAVRTHEENFCLINALKCAAGDRTEVTG